MSEPRRFISRTEAKKLAVDILEQAEQARRDADRATPTPAAASDTHESERFLELLGDFADAVMQHALTEQDSDEERESESAVNILHGDLLELYDRAASARRPPADEETPSPEAHSHCWHAWGVGGGSVSGDGSSSSYGSNRCCHCGEIQSYSYESGPRAPIVHGPYASEFQPVPLYRHPAAGAPNEEPR